MKLAYRDKSLSETKLRVLAKAPAYEAILRMFGEIFQNTADAILAEADKYYEVHGAEVSPLVVSIVCDFEDNRLLNMICLTLTDNGPGFDEELLGMIATSHSRKQSQYIFQSVSAKHVEDTAATPKKKLLFGGSGQALKVLIGFADYGDYGYKNKLRSREEVALPEVTTEYVLNFDNQYGSNGKAQGAIIRLSTPSVMRAATSASTRTEDGAAVPEVELPRAVQQRNTLFKRQKLNDDNEPRESLEVIPRLAH